MADMTRPAEKLSTSQSAVLTATGKAKVTPYFYTASLKLCTLLSEFSISTNPLLEKRLNYNALALTITVE